MTNDGGEHRKDHQEPKPEQITRFYLDEADSFIPSYQLPAYDRREIEEQE